VQPPSTLEYSLYDPKKSCHVGQTEKQEGRTLSFVASSETLRAKARAYAHPGKEEGSRRVSDLAVLFALLSAKRSNTSTSHDVIPALMARKSRWRSDPCGSFQTQMKCAHSLFVEDRWVTS
jgi:hypothetical protein